MKRCNCKRSIPTPRENAEREKGAGRGCTGNYSAAEWIWRPQSFWVVILLFTFFFCVSKYYIVHCRMRFKVKRTLLAEALALSRQTSLRTICVPFPLSTVQVHFFHFSLRRQEGYRLLGLTRNNEEDLAAKMETYSKS